MGDMDCTELQRKKTMYRVLVTGGAPASAMKLVTDERRTYRAEECHCIFARYEGGFCFRSELELAAVRTGERDDNGIDMNVL